MATAATLSVKVTGDVTDIQIKLNKLVKALDDTAAQLKGKGALLSASLTAPIQGLGLAAIKAAADNEQLEVAFTTMLGSADRAASLMADLSEFAARTPFESAQIQRGAKLLLAYGTEAEDVTDALRQLGDLAAGVGAPLEDLAYLYGTAQVQGRLFAGDINQFTNRGIPILQALADTMGVTTGEIKAMVEEGEVGFPELQAALQRLTGEGGKFNGLMQAQSRTLLGLFSTLKDNVALTLIDLGNIIVDAFDLKSAAERVLMRVEQIRDGLKGLAAANPQLLRTGVLVTAVVGMIGPALVGLGFALNVVKNSLSAFSALVPLLTALSGPLLTVIGVVGALGAAWYFNWFNMREVVAGVVSFVTERWAALTAAFRDGSVGVREFVAALTGSGAAADAAEGAAAAVQGWLATALPAALASAQSAWDGAWAAIRGTWEGVWPPIAAGLAAAWTWLQVSLPAAVVSLQSAWVGAWAAVQGAFTGAWEVVGPALAAAWTWLQVSLPGAVAFWQSAWAGAWAAAQGAFTAAWGAIGPSLAAAWTWLQVTLPAAVAFLQAAWAGAWSAVQGAFTAAWGAVGPALAAVWTTLQVAVPAAVVWLQTTWAAAWAAMQDAFTTAWGAIGPALAAAWTTLQVSLPGAVSSLQAAWSAAWPAMQGAYTAVWDAIGPALAAIGPTVSGAAAEIGGALAAAQGNIDGAAQSLSSLAQGALTAAVQVAMFFLPALTRIGEALLGLPQSFAPVGEALWGLLAQLGEFWTQVQPLLTGLAMLVGGVLGVGGVVGMNAFAAAIQAAGPVVAASIREITAVIKLVGTVLGEVTTLVSAIAAGDWTTAWESIRSIGGAALQFLIDTLNNLKDVAVAVGSAIYDAVKNSLDDLNIDAGAVMNTIKGWWDSAWDTMAQAFQGVVDGINNIKSLVDGLKQSIDDFAGWVGGLKITPPWAGWSVPDLSWVPGMGGGQPANGGGAGQLGITYAQGGVYKVGESGRAELVVLPRGAQVIPHRQTEQILAGGGGGVTVIIQNANLRSEQDSWRLAYQIDELRRRRRV